MLFVEFKELKFSFRIKEFPSNIQFDPLKELEKLSKIESSPVNSDS
jgi:hypothetical protein